MELNIDSTSSADILDALEHEESGLQRIKLSRPPSRDIVW